MKISRRSFLQATAATGLLAAGVYTTNPVLTTLAQSTGAKTAPAGKWLSTACQGCTTWCSVQAYVINNRVVKVRGNPNAKSNHGNICPRPHLAIQQLYDPDRIKTPMKRTNPKKGRNEDPKFVPISWEEAMNTVADKMLELRKNNESHKFSLFRGRYSGVNDPIYYVMPQLFGSPNNISHSSICAEAEKFGAYYTEAYWDYRDFDLKDTRYVLLWGGDPVASNRMVPHAMNAWGDMHDYAKVACVDPRLSASAAKAHEWLPVIPGEDGALAMAMAHVILAQGMWYKPFVGDFKDGINKFKKGEVVNEEDFEEKLTHGIVKWWNLELKDRTPEWAAERCGITAEQIRRVATEFAAEAPRAISWLTPGAAMHVRGAYTAMACHGLNGLVGSVDNKGGTMRSQSVPIGKMPAYDKYKDDVAKKGTSQKKIDQRGTLEFPAMASGKPGSGVVTNRVADAMLTANPYDLKMIIAYWINTPFSCTGAQRWEKALEKLPFLVHITTNASEMTQYADIALPASFSMFEKWGFVNNKFNKHAYCAIQQPVVKPVWDVYIDETEMMWMLADALAKKGFPNLLDYYRNETKDPETGKNPTNAQEFGLYYTKMLTYPLWKADSTAKGDKLQGWADFLEKGVWNTPEYVYQKTWANFGTKTKKFEFYSETLKASLTEHAEKNKTTVDAVMEATKYQARGEQAFIPHYEEPFRWGDAKEFPYVFFEYRSRLNREGRSANTIWYQEFKDVDPGDEAWGDVAKINPVDGVKLGLKDGDRIKLTSPTGSITCTAKLWEGVRPGTIGKCYGQGHWAYGRVASLDYSKKLPRGGSNNELLPADWERLSGSTARHGGVTRIKVEKI